MSIGRCILVLLFVVPAGWIRADGLLYQLPKDGAWASYDFEVAARGIEGPQTVNGTLRIASVGQTIENKAPCRWIEIQLDMTMTIQDRKATKTHLYKVLIPEKYLAKGETPLEHALRTWEQSEKKDPVKMEDPNRFQAGPLPIILSGPWKDVRSLEKTEIESKLGKLPCEGIQGTLVFALKGTDDVKCTFENRVHAKSPFGVVTSRWTLQMPGPKPSNAGSLEWTLKLADFGENAVSKMPEAK
jgi:hypothetical protein